MFPSLQDTKTQAVGYQTTQAQTRAHLQVPVVLARRLVDSHEAQRLAVEVGQQVVFEDWEHKLEVDNVHNVLPDVECVHVLRLKECALHGKQAVNDRYSALER